MTTDYDTIAEDYRRAKQQPWRTYIESFTLMNIIGDLREKSVIDLACGEGFYTRILRQAGAAKVVGIDLSEGMIELARAEETRYPLGVTYQVQDGRTLELGQEFDLVVAAYLFNYAKDRSELDAMCRGIARVLKPGGRLVTVNSNPSANFAELPSFRKYGFETRIGDKLAEGSPIIWTFHLAQHSIEVENYYLNLPTHEEALTHAGLGEIRWHSPSLSPQRVAEDTPDSYWNDFLEYPPITFIECRKQIS